MKTYKKSEQAKEYWNTAQSLVHYVNKSKDFTRNFLEIPKNSLWNHFMNSMNGKQAATYLIEKYSVSLAKGGHNNGKWAKYLFNRYDKNRWNTLHEVATNYAKSIA
tara:strand:+ start:1825 stop:2142 length:318 start_codon:yes stop_codon:yes gene_type:complete